MKIMVTGSKGQLGSQLIKILKNGNTELGRIDSLYGNAKVFETDADTLDITKLEDVICYVESIKPNIIINPAYTNVDESERHPDDAYKVNAIGARNIAIAAEKVDSKLVHISTDYVFSGDGTKPYKEFDIPNPQSVYGKSKLLGESYISKLSSKAFILRTAWLYGYNGKNFVKTIIKAAKEKGHLDVVDDQMGNPTNAEDLAYHILKVALTDEYGIYHITGNGECSWYDFACKIVEYSSINCEVNPTKSDKLKRLAKRPSYSCLDHMMLRCTVGDEMRQWEDALRVFIKNTDI